MTSINRWCVLACAVLAILFSPDTSLSSPGVAVGTTFDNVVNSGPIDRTIVRDDFQGSHFTWVWTDTIVGYPSSAMYNFYDPGSGWSGPVQVPPGPVLSSGCATIEVDHAGRALVAYHARWFLDSYFTTVSIDLLRGLGIFAGIIPDSTARPAPLDPHIAGRDSNFCIVAMNSWLDDTLRLYTTMSNDGGWTWQQFQDHGPVLTSWTHTIAYSGNSDKVGVVYIDSTFYAPNGNVWFVESTDGGASWQAPERVTNFSPGDTIGAFIQPSILYHLSDDEPHIVFDVCYNLSTLSAIWHWSPSTGLTTVAEALWDSRPGWAHVSGSRPSLGNDANGNLFCVWSQFTMEDTSAAGWSNGEIYGAYSTDNGVSWLPLGSDGNLTNSPTPGAPPGQCDDDRHPCIAEIVDDCLHIFYLNSKDAGTAGSEGQSTLDTLLYLTVFNPTGIEEGGRGSPIQGQPIVVLGPNQPNPFRRQTIISYRVEHGQDRGYPYAMLEIYDVSGRLINQLACDIGDTGQHTVRWDGRDQNGSEVGSGVYFCKFKGPMVAPCRKMLLIK